MIIWQFRGDETMRSFGRIASIAVTLISLPSMAGAADIRLLSVARVHGDPTLPNQSGEKAERILVQAGILDALKPRLKIVPGQAASQELIAKGEVEMGLYNVSEIPEDKGLAFAGPVPTLLQVTTSYEGAVMSDGSEPQAARAFIRFLASPEARAKWLGARLEPPADRW